MPSVQTTTQEKEKKEEKLVMKNAGKKLPQEEEQTISSNFFNIYQNLSAQGKKVFNYNNILNTFNNLDSTQFSNLVWIFQFYDEIFQLETPNLKQELKDSIYSITGTEIEFYEQNIKQHKIFKNLLFNVKQISILQPDGTWKIMSYQDLQNLYLLENEFYLGRIDMSDVLKNSLITLGYESEIKNNFAGVANFNHDVGYKYFVVSSEPITFQQFLDILPQTRVNEVNYYDNFDNIGEDFPTLTDSGEMSFIYMKSNYTYHSEASDLSLKGIKEDLSGTEIIEQDGIVPKDEKGF